MADLDALIARVAVLRTEAREADKKAREAAKTAEEANDKYREAQHQLDTEVSSRIDALDSGDR